jgi:hypothetical protein
VVVVVKHLRSRLQGALGVNPFQWDGKGIDRTLYLDDSTTLHNENNECRLRHHVSIPAQALLTLIRPDASKKVTRRINILFYLQPENFRFSLGRPPRSMGYDSYEGP